MRTKILDITQDVRKNGAPDKWVYRVRHRGRFILVSVRIKSRFLIYPRPIAPPRLITEVHPDESLQLSPGEWCEIFFQGKWCRLLDADNRDQCQ